MSHAIARTLAAAASLAAATAHAVPDQLCVPDVAGAEPAWSNPGLSPAKKERRWDGALVRKLSAGVHDARLRALYSPAAETVYVELLVDGDPSLDAGADLFLVALGDETGTVPELFIRFDPAQACAIPADCAGAGVALDPSAISYAAATSGPSSLTWGELSTVNPSASFAVANPWIVVTEVAGTFTTVLSFELVVPVDASGEIRPDLRIYGNAVVHVPGISSATIAELPILCTSSSPTSNDCLIGIGPLTDLPSDLPIGNLEDSWSVLRSGCPALQLWIP
jgi:hypothetical protein